LQHIKSYPNKMGMELIFLQIADTGCFLLGIRWHIMDVYVQVACIMARVQHCTFVVQKRQINILVKQEYFAVKYRQIEERAAEVVRYIVNNNATVR